MTARASSRIYVCAGEPSGDLHAARLIAALRTARPDFEFVGLGGERMAAAGALLRANLVDRAVMGFRKVVREMGYLANVTVDFVRELSLDPPAAVILVDYPGLNLNLARIARRCGVPVIYYICPQVWAWAPWRIRRVARRCDLLLAILPFEEELYRAAGAQVEYVGHPLFDHLAEVEKAPLVQEYAAPDRPVLALFPGSRRQEVEESLPLMLATATELLRKEPRARVVVSCQRAKLQSAVDALCAGAPFAVDIATGPAHTLQRQASLALVVSGTASLEQAYFGVPMVVIYPVRPWERRAFGFFSVTPFISLVNLIAGTKVVPELLVAPSEAARIVEQATPLLAGPAREAMLERLRGLRAEHFHPGATARAAQKIVEFLGRHSL
ncbi:MAG: lipid-A-disaccharide synthase [Planctomycetota bacterium]